MLAICGLLTGGLAVFSSNDFATPGRFKVAEGLLSQVHVRSSYTEFHAPLLFHHYGRGKPFRLYLQLFDYRKRFVSVELESVSLTFDDGEVISSNKAWRRKLRPAAQYAVVEGKYTKTELLELDAPLDVTPPRATPFTIRLKGRMVQQNGERVPFTGTARFEVERTAGVLPYWWVWYLRTYYGS
jgi:hypothetical protein